TDAGISNPWGESTLVISALNPYHPFGFALTPVGEDANLLLLVRRPGEGWPRRYEQAVPTWYVAAGLARSCDLRDRPESWDVNGVRSESSAEQTNYGSYNVRRINEGARVLAAGATVAGCVSLKLFGGAATITREMLDFKQPVVRDESENT